MPPESAAWCRHSARAGVAIGADGLIVEVPSLSGESHERRRTILVAASIRDR